MKTRIDPQQATGSVVYGQVSPATVSYFTAMQLQDRLCRPFVPLKMSPDDRLYWSLRWRVDTRESERARERGEYERFDSDDPLDAARWLISDDE